MMTTEQNPPSKKQKTINDNNRGPPESLRTTDDDNNEQRQLPRTATSQSKWGFHDVLIECGICPLQSSPPPSPSSSRKRRNNNNLGCRLSDSSITPIRFRASLVALLKEMNQNGMDHGNERVLESMQNLVLTGDIGEEETAATAGGQDEQQGGGEGNCRQLLRRMLLPLYHVVKTTTEGEENRIVEYDSTSLIKILLRVETLQPRLLESLIQKLVEYGSDPSSIITTTDLLNSSNDDDDCYDPFSIPKQILSHIRWLDHIYDPSSLTSSLLSSLTMICSTLDNNDSSNDQKSLVLDIIATLPDVISSSSSSSSVGSSDDVEQLLSTLNDLSQSDPKLLIPSLDAITSLPLSIAQLALVIDNALESLPSASSLERPSLCSFLMSTVPRCCGGGSSRTSSSSSSSPMTAFISALRQLPLILSSSSLDDTTTTTLTLESLSLGFRHNETICHALLQTLSKNVDSCGPIDIVLLICVAVAPHHRRKVSSFFDILVEHHGCERVKSLIDDAFQRRRHRRRGGDKSSLLCHPAMDLADELLRSQRDACRDVGGYLYGVLFREFCCDAVVRQEIIVALVSHVAGGESCGWGALRVLGDLARNDDDEEEEEESLLRPYLPFLTSLLERLSSFDEEGLRRLFLMLFEVGDGRRDEEGNMDDIMIVIRKHLGLNSGDLKKIGIIGAVCFAVTRSDRLRREELVKQQQPKGGLLVMDDDEDETCLNSPPQQYYLNSPTVQEVTNLLELAHASCLPSKRQFKSGRYARFGVNGHKFHLPELLPLGFFFDELCLAVQGGRLAPPLREWILDKFSDDLEELHVGEFKEVQNDSVPMTITGNDNDTQHTTTTHAPLENPNDASLLSPNLSHPTAPPGQMRFNTDGHDALIYVKFLPLLSSPDPTTRSLPQQLCPLLRLLASCHDVRFFGGSGGGVAEIDAVLGCPMFLPHEKCVSFDEFRVLNGEKKMVTCLCLFYATCWTRELINSFVHAATFTNENENGSKVVEDDEGRNSNAGGDDTTRGNDSKTVVVRTPAKSVASTVAYNSTPDNVNRDELRGKIVNRLTTLVGLEEDLKYTSSVCPEFAPPGMSRLALPDGLTLDDFTCVDDDMFTNSSNSSPTATTTDTSFFPSPASSSSTTNNQTTKKKTSSSSDHKSKQRKIKLKQKLSHSLSTRTYTALRPLSYLAVLALGFPELGVVGNDCGQSSQQMTLSLGSSQLQKMNLKVGGPVVTLLLRELVRHLDLLFVMKKGMKNPFFAAKKKAAASKTTTIATSSSSSSSSSQMRDLSDNPYTPPERWETYQKRSSPAFRRIATVLGTYVRGGVFSALHEHLATLAELRGGGMMVVDDDEDDEDGAIPRRRGGGGPSYNEKETLECTSHLLKVVQLVVSTESLTNQRQGRRYLNAVLKQLAEGDRIESLRLISVRKDAAVAGGGNDDGRIRASIEKLLFDVFELVDEIATGGDTEDLSFVVRGVECLQSVLKCILRMRAVDSSVDGHCSTTDGIRRQQQQQNNRRDISILHKKLSEMCHGLMQKTWGRKVNYNKSNIGIIISAYVEHSIKTIPNDAENAARLPLSDLGRINTLTNVVTHILGELPDTVGHRGPLDAYPTCCLQSFYTYFSTALSFFPKELNYLLDSSLGRRNVSNMRRCGMVEEKALEYIRELVSLLIFLFDLVKENPTYVKKPTLLVQLREGTKFMEIFVKRAIPFLQQEDTFREHKDIIVNIIKEVQIGTRQLHNVILWGKKEKDSNLTNETPRAKKVLETFIHKTKVMMRKNNCLSAFWGGNLKNKNIDGSILEEVDYDDGDEVDENHANSDNDSGSGDDSCGDT